MNSRFGFLGLLIVLCLSGCVRVDIGEHAPTIGEQLMDLYQAHEIGAVTDAEFARIRNELIRAL